MFNIPGSEKLSYFKSLNTYCFMNNYGNLTISKSLVSVGLIISHNQLIVEIEYNKNDILFSNSFKKIPITERVFELSVKAVKIDINNLIYVPDHLRHQVKLASI